MPQYTVALSYWHVSSCTSRLVAPWEFFSLACVRLFSSELTFKASGIKMQLQYFRYALLSYILVKVFFACKNNRM